MKASIKLRDDEEKPPLLRAKVPVSIFSLPFAACVAAGDPSDLSFHLLTSFHVLPSLKLSYHANPTTPASNPFALTLKSGAGPLGSPAGSPLHISFRLSPSPCPSFSVLLKPRLGHFSLSKSAASPPNPNPNRKENDGAVHHLIPVAPPATDQTGLNGLMSGGVGVRVRTEVPVGRRAGLKVRWAVKLPPEARGAGVLGRLPYLTLDKISLERSPEVAVEEAKDAKEWREEDVEAMKGMCFWMGREVEELKKENDSIRQGIEAVRQKFLKANGNGKSVGNATIASAAGKRGNTGAITAVGR